MYAPTVVVSLRADKVLEVFRTAQPTRTMQDSLIINVRGELGWHRRLFSDATTAALWGAWLVWRLVHFTRVMAGIRYAIPAKAIFWIPFGEFFPRYGFYREFWLEPWKYPAEIGVTALLFAALLALTVLVPQRRSTVGGN